MRAEVNGQERRSTVRLYEIVEVVPGASLTARPVLLRLPLAHRLLR